MLRHVPTPPRHPVRRCAKAVASASALVLLLTACSGGTVNTAEPTPSPITSEAANDGGTAVEDNTAVEGGTAVEDNTAVEPNTAEPGSSLIDYCVPAREGYDALGDMLDATDRKSAETGMLNDTGNVAAMNSAGEEMLTHIDAVVTHWTQAQATLADSTIHATGSAISGEDASQAFTEYFEYLDMFARPEAQIAATAGSIGDYDTAVATMLNQRAALESVLDGSVMASAQALNSIIEFTVEHCEIATLP